jgi:MFS superfamily sulfate permease-like transporter
MENETQMTVIIIVCVSVMLCGLFALFVGIFT